ncbi:MAG: hypothetical protein VXZ82_17010 [Planctomycetota bacterium]|nr:hypothetical protein [Planctomycetota bacterium]
MSVRNMRLRIRPNVVCTFAILLAASQIAVAQVPVSTGGKGRKLAPGVLQVIEPAAVRGETAEGPVDLPLVALNPDLDWQPNFDPKTEIVLENAKQVTFRKEVHCLQFAFKPVRMIEVNGKVVWYLLYRVRYLGGDLKPVPEPDKYQNEVYGKPQAVSADWVRFVPTFRLDSLGMGKVYMDRVVPGAVEAIAAKERVGQPILDSKQIMKEKVELTTATKDNALWGVATWTDVDPRIDFFSVTIQGLTNAQKLETAGDKIKYLQKTLVLHFSRPGDTVLELEDHIRFGIPALKDEERQKYVLSQYGQKERLDYLWDYR